MTTATRLPVELFNPYKCHSVLFPNSATEGAIIKMPSEMEVQGVSKRLSIVIFSDGPKKFEKCYNPMIFRELI